MDENKEPLKRKQFKKTIIEYQEDNATFARYHREWKQWAFKYKRGFFPIFTPDFMKKFKDVSGNALKLYLYLGTYINNQDGYALVGIETISKDLKATKRTVHNWFQELREHRLVIRIQPGYKQPTFTCLLPYHDDFLEDRDFLKSLINQYATDSPDLDSDLETDTDIEIIDISQLLDD